VQQCGARVYGLELGCSCSDIRWVGTVVSCQVLRERLLFEVTVDEVVSAVGVVRVIGCSVIAVTARGW
jgi:starvation-inducible outer membrane lipoprotein